MAWKLSQSASLWRQLGVPLASRAVGLSHYPSPQTHCCTRRYGETQTLACVNKLAMVICWWYMCLDNGTCTIMKINDWALPAVCKQLPSKSRPRRRVKVKLNQWKRHTWTWMYVQEQITSRLGRTLLLNLNQSTLNGCGDCWTSKNHLQTPYSTGGDSGKTKHAKPTLHPRKDDSVY